MCGAFFTKASVDRGMVSFLYVL